MTNDLGATEQDWNWFDFGLGLGANLLPCVPAAPDVQVLPGSALEGRIGKIPSQFNRDGLAHGMKEWQKRPILSNEISLWQADRRLNMCVRTGEISEVHALDIDVSDPVRSAEIVAAIEAITGPLPKRYRENSGKCLLMLAVKA